MAPNPQPSSSSTTTTTTTTASFGSCSSSTEPSMTTTTTTTCTTELDPGANSQTTTTTTTMTQQKKKKKKLTKQEKRHMKKRSNNTHNTGSSSCTNQPPSTTTTTTTTTALRPPPRLPPPRPLMDWIPPYLRPYVHPFDHADTGEFCYSRYFDVQLMVQLMAHGFLPMATTVRVATAAESRSRQGGRRRPSQSLRSADDDDEEEEESVVVPILMPKLHRERSCIALSPLDQTGTTTTTTTRRPLDHPTQSSHGPQSPPPEPLYSMDHALSYFWQANPLHIRQSVRKKARRYTLTVNQAWTQVVQACQDQHARHSWLHPPLMQALEQLHQSQAQQEQPQSQPTAMATLAIPSKHPDSTTTTTRTIQVPVRVFSIELWATTTDTDSMKDDDDDNDDTTNSTRRRRLVAGEVAYSVGDRACFTSMTGFSKESSAGSVQLLALGRALQQSGYPVWDLGMEMDYKQDLGARHPWPRAVFCDTLERLVQQEAASRQQRQQSRQGEDGEEEEEEPPSSTRRQNKKNHHNHSNSNRSQPSPLEVWLTPQGRNARDIIDGVVVGVENTTV